MPAYHDTRNKAEVSTLDRQVKAFAEGSVEQMDSAENRLETLSRRNIKWAT